MNKKKGSRLFDMIAPIYGLFFNHQRRRYTSIIKQAAAKFDITKFQTAIDVGCGTGALCSVLHDQGVEVTGIDPAAKMLEIAGRKTGNKGISFIQANALEGLPFADNSFEIAVSSYVAHSLRSEVRVINVDKRASWYICRTR